MTKNAAHRMLREQHSTRRLRIASSKAGVANSWAFFRSFIMPHKKKDRTKMTFLSDITAIPDNPESTSKTRAS